MDKTHKTIAGLFWGVCCSSAIFLFLSFGFLATIQTEAVVVQGSVAGATVDQEENDFASIIPFASLTPTQDFSLFDTNQVSARSLVALDVKTGDVLLEKNPNDVYTIASLSKLVTAWLLFERGLDSSREATVQAKSNQTLFATWEIFDVHEGDAVSGISVPPTEMFSTKMLLAASLISSANNATFSLVESQGLTPQSFRSEVEALLAKFRLRNTSLFEPTGLSVNNTSTASDLARIAQMAFSYEDIRTITQTKRTDIESTAGNAYSISSTNNLLKESPLTILGGKTGYLDEARFTYVILTKHITGRELVIVLLGSDTSEARFSETEKIIHWLNSSYQ